MSLDRINAFRRHLQRASADRTFETAHGTAIISDSVPDVYDANYLSVETPAVSALDLAEEATAALETSHHVRVFVEDGSVGVADDFANLGFERSTHLVLRHTGEPDRRVDTSAIREVTLNDLASPKTEATLREPWGDADIAEQLQASRRLVAQAVPTRFFAAYAAGGIAGWCELRRHDGVAQIEDVEVLAEHRGRGLGRAIVQHALDEAVRADDLVFLEALADDWPRELYAKLGFTAVGCRDVYTRLPSPLTRLRLRTPRLELRLATRAEAQQLDGAAQALGSTPDAIRFTAFLDGAPIGVQTLDFEPAFVTTGSWVEEAFAGQGLDTEMEAAALTYAFATRGATAARSANGELRREAFRSPVPVTVDGVRPLA